MLTNTIIISKQSVTHIQHDRQGAD